MGLGRRRERTECQTTLRACHVEEVGEASADPQPILAEGSQSVHRCQRLSRHESVGTGVSPNGPQERTASCPWVLFHRGHHCGCSCHGAVGEQAQTFFLPAVMEGKAFVVLMQAAALFCPEPVLAVCKAWLVAWLGLAGRYLQGGLTG